MVPKKPYGVVKWEQNDEAIRVSLKDHFLADRGRWIQAALWSPAVTLAFLSLLLSFLGEFHFTVVAFLFATYLVTTFFEKSAKAVAGEPGWSLVWRRNHGGAGTGGEFSGEDLDKVVPGVVVVEEGALRLIRPNHEVRIEPEEMRLGVRRVVRRLLLKDYVTSEILLGYGTGVLTFRARDGGRLAEDLLRRFELTLVRSSPDGDFEVKNWT